jgi:cell division initiation protein
MITPIEIQSKSFKSGMGYSKADVDSFIQTVAADFESLYRENLELKDKINILNDGINHYKSIEKSLQKALVLAEQTAEETINSAKSNATVIEQEAILKAQSIVADAKIELDHVHTKTIELIQQYEKYRSQYKALAQAQVELLESESFNIEAASFEAFENLQTSATEHYDQINASAMYQNQTPVKMTSEDEEYADETLNEEDFQVNDIASIFDDAENEEN